MYQLVYVSSATVAFPKLDLLALLAKSRENNRKAGLTGLLLYKDGNFMQVLEGEKEAVMATHFRIECDRRHRGMLTLLQGPIAERRFAEWSMGFRDLSSPDAMSVPGYSPFLNTKLTGQEFASDPASSEKLLLTFKKAM